MAPSRLSSWEGHKGLHRDACQWAIVLAKNNSAENAEILTWLQHTRTHSTAVSPTLRQSAPVDKLNPSPYVAAIPSYSVDKFNRLPTTVTFGCHQACAKFNSLCLHKAHVTRIACFIKHDQYCNGNAFRGTTATAGG